MEYGDEFCATKYMFYKAWTYTCMYTCRYSNSDSSSTHVIDNISCSGSENRVLDCDYTVGRSRLFFNMAVLCGGTQYSEAGECVCVCVCVCVWVCVFVWRVWGHTVQPRGWVHVCECMCMCEECVCVWRVWGHTVHVCECTSLIVIKHPSN